MSEVKQGSAKAGRGSELASNTFWKEIAVVVSCGAAAGALFNAAFSIQPWSTGGLLGGVLSAIMVWWMS